jgi:RNA polymerase sigma factor (sigma-70 family)
MVGAAVLGSLYASGRMAIRMAMADAENHLDYDSSRQKWTLTKEAFDRLLASLDSDASTAGEKYLLMRRNLVRYFEGRSCPFAEDHADEAINRVARRLADGEDVLDINGYCYGIARFMLLEVYKSREREEQALKELPSLRLVDSDPAESDEDGDRLECLNHCLEKLPTNSKQLIVGYYQGDKQSRIENRKRIGKEMGIPNQALRSRAVRLREKLEACLSTCLKKKRAGTSQNHLYGH